MAFADATLRDNGSGAFDAALSDGVPTGTNLSVIVSGNWKSVANAYVLVSGAWKEVNTTEVVVSDAWKVV